MTIGELNELQQICKTEYAGIHKRMRMLDATDNGDFWKAINAKFPSYQILPDTNFISYVKSNLLASIYTVGKSASMIPTSEEDKDIVMDLNIWMEHAWDLLKVPYYQFQAGERAALLNMGITQVGWSEDADRSLGVSEGKQVVLNNVDPMKFMRDPFAKNLKTAGYCMTNDSYHKSVFLEDSRYAKNFEKYAARRKGDGGVSDAPKYNHEAKPRKDYHELWIYWVWEDGKLNEYHTVDDTEILHVKEDLRPRRFPFADLYCNLPGKRLVGTSECAKVFANNMAYNLLDSIALTAEYKNQRPPKFISSASGLNLQSFMKYGNEADYSFIVNGAADKAVHYHEYPGVSPNVINLGARLQNGIQVMTGVDGKYTGRDTGSILTTGGIEDMLDRATMIDTPKIALYESYARDLTELILLNYIEHSPKRKYFIRGKQDRQYKTFEVDFPEIDEHTVFQYSLSISSELPKNKARIAAVANVLMEKQMQYGGGEGGVELLTHEEWLMMQDLPNKEYMLERMGVQRMNSTIEDVTQTLFEYANLTREGLGPEDAIMATAHSMDQKRKGIVPQEPAVPPMVQDNMMPPMM